MGQKGGGISTIASETTRVRELIDDVRRGLTAPQKWLPSKYLYDAAGSELFEQITQLEEYYPTRAEIGLLERYAKELIQESAPEEIVEIGAGASRKNQLLLEALHSIGGSVYAPIDISGDALQVTERELKELYPWLEFRGFVGDFAKDLARVPRRGRRLVCFLGSTIGNLNEPNRAAFFRSMSVMLQGDEAYLMGVDLVKPTERIERAYNDSKGITAAFNKNVLRFLNRELNADFDLESFDHRAFYNREEQRVEIYLVAREAQTVHLPGADLKIRFEAEETLLTEISCKFHRAQVERELGLAGLRLDRWIEGTQGEFALVLARLDSPDSSGSAGSAGP